MRATGGAETTATVGHAMTHPPDSHCATRPLEIRAASTSSAGATYFRSLDSASRRKPSRSATRSLTARFSFDSCYRAQRSCQVTFWYPALKKMLRKAGGGRRRRSSYDHRPLDRLRKAESTAVERAHEGIRGRRDRDPPYRSRVGPGALATPPDATDLPPGNLVATLMRGAGSDGRRSADRCATRSQRRPSCRTR